MAYAVKLEVFEGPLDLLLHLIQKAQIDIYDIPVAAITDQYMGYLRLMAEFDLEIASEFVSLAATLLSIKVRTLLPRSKSQANSEENEDPRQELVDALLEYSAFKNAAAYLRQLEEHMAGRWPRPEQPTEKRKSAGTDSAPLRATLWDLIIAMQQILVQNTPPTPVEIHLERYTVRAAFSRILRALRQSASGVKFNDLLQAKHKREIVVLFLAVLELGRQGRLRIVQPTPFGEIVVEPVKEGRPDAKLA